MGDNGMKIFRTHQYMDGTVKTNLTKNILNDIKN